MGTWGSGLYQDDFASDLKNTIALIAKVPAEGEKLLHILRQMLGDIQIEDEDGTTFWLVVADQFERRGITCPEAFAKATSIIEGQQDLKRLEDLGLDQRGIKKRKVILQELFGRLQLPRPA